MLSQHFLRLLRFMAIEPFFPASWFALRTVKNKIVAKKKKTTTNFHLRSQEKHAIGATKQFLGKICRKRKKKKESGSN